MLVQTDKRDTLIASEKKYQQQWKQDGVFQQDAPSLKDVPFHSITPAELREQQPKNFATMAYPYMNGEIALSVMVRRASS